MCVCVCDNILKCLNKSEKSIFQNSYKGYIEQILFTSRNRNI